MVKVKVCGLTRVPDAQLASDLGASAVGFVFWRGSPRYVDRAAARAIVKELRPDVAPIGIFVDPSIEEVDETVSQVGLRGVQLHGDESVAFCEELRGLASMRGGIDLIKAVALRGAESAEAAAALPSFVTVLLDAHDSTRKGGTGRTVEWSVAATVARRRRVFLAGGLTPTNVAAAVEAVCPYGLDVSSGVETAPGVKDAGLMRQFFERLTAEGDGADTSRGVHE